MPQVGLVTNHILAATLDEFLSADTATQAELAAELLCAAYEMRANIYRDSSDVELEIPAKARMDYIKYFETCAAAIREASKQIRRIGENLAMPA